MAVFTICLPIRTIRELKRGFNLSPSTFVRTYHGLYSDIKNFLNPFRALRIFVGLFVNVRLCECLPKCWSYMYTRVCVRVRLCASDHTLLGRAKNEKLIRCEDQVWETTALGERQVWGSEFRFFCSTALHSFFYLRTYIEVRVCENWIILLTQRMAFTKRFSARPI